MTNDKNKLFQRSLVYELLSHAFARPTLNFMDFVESGEFCTHMVTSLKALPYCGNVDPHNIEVLANRVKALRFDGVLSEYEEITSYKINYLYECNYQNRFSALTEMADIAGFYKAFSYTYSGEKPDFLPMELEFMRMVILKEIRAIANEEGEKVEICAEVQKGFLDSHIGRWIPLMASFLEPFTFYGPLAAFAHEWIQAECTLMGIKPDVLDYVIGEDKIVDKIVDKVADEEQCPVAFVEDWSKDHETLSKLYT
ncbi:MAG: molecular chaperone TorD family protein [Candidatus Magnetoovum sp. WYHC-5]|nr:molecular chaperone TorD family protein [Candidatus Magnetoovum sp. WYHC-5]